MGFNINSVRLLTKANQHGVNFEDTITIGRQGLHLRQKELVGLIDEVGLASNDNYESCIASNYAESFLKLLGAENVDSIDASNYEEATIIHDLNLPISDEYKSKYTLVIDGGSLEHIFNFPQAIKNCMELINIGGSYIGITPTNNFCGHGFYQFSPELYFRIFNKTNGFELIKMYFFVDDRSGKASIFEVSDPLLAGERVTMINSQRSYLFVVARKIEEKELFKITPQQSDYEHLSWKGNSNESSQSVSKPIKILWIKKMIPASLRLSLYKRKRKVVKLYNRLLSPTGDSNSSYFKKIDKPFNKTN